MKKVFLGLATIGLLVIPLAGLAQATTAPEVNPLEALKTITNYLFYILLLVAALCIIIAAYYFVTAAGSPEQTAKARNFVLYAVIGVIVAFLAKGLVVLVGTMLGYPVTW